jgi:hypothetical protein
MHCKMRGLVLDVDSTLDEMVGIQTVNSPGNSDQLQGMQGQARANWSRALTMLFMELELDQCRYFSDMVDSEFPTSSPIKLASQQSPRNQIQYEIMPFWSMILIMMTPWWVDEKKGLEILLLGWAGHCVPWCCDIMIGTHVMDLCTGAYTWVIVLSSNKCQPCAMQITDFTFRVARRPPRMRCHDKRVHQHNRTGWWEPENDYMCSRLLGQAAQWGVDRVVYNSCVFW